MEYIKRLFTGGYDEIWKAVIRPAKDEYTDSELGPERFIIKNKLFRRKDFYIFNKFGHKLY